MPPISIYTIIYVYTYLYPLSFENHGISLTPTGLRRYGHAKARVRRHAGQVAVLNDPCWMMYLFIIRALHVKVYIYSLY